MISCLFDPAVSAVQLCAVRVSVISRLLCALQAYKAAAIGIIKEYMASADSAEVAEALKELGQPDLQHIFVKQVRPRC